MYDHRKNTTFTPEETEEMVGKKARLPLTGMFVGSGESEAGPYMVFEVDPCWGLTPGFKMIFDLEAFDGIEDV